MKRLIFFVFFSVTFITHAQTTSFFSFNSSVFINEIHYDNEGGDIQEGVELAALSGTDLGCYKLYFVNGNNGQYYATLSLDTVVVESHCGMGFVFFYKSSIQNGSSTSGDAIALYNVCQDTLVQFLSYEGEVTATNGPFSGATAVDIGVFQNSDSIGTSLQLQGSLDSTFYWASDSSTYGYVNTQQNFCQFVGIQENTLHPFKLYPNPAKDGVNLSLVEQGLSLDNIWLLNLQGRVIRRYDPSIPTLALDNIPSGTYFLKLHTNKGVFTNQLIVLK